MKRHCSGGGVPVLVHEALLRLSTAPGLLLLFLVAVYVPRVTDSKGLGAQLGPEAALGEQWGLPGAARL